VDGAGREGSARRIGCDVGDPRCWLGCIGAPQPPWRTARDPRGRIALTRARQRRSRSCCGPGIDAQFAGLKLHAWTRSSPRNKRAPALRCAVDQIALALHTNPSQEASMVISLRQMDAIERDRLPHHASAPYPIDMNTCGRAQPSVRSPREQRAHSHNGSLLGELQVRSGRRFACDLAETTSASRGPLAEPIDPADSAAVAALPRQRARAARSPRLFLFLRNLFNQ
jgi:hypothetical protein